MSDSFKDWLHKEMKDPEFRELMEEAEAGYQVESLRLLRRLTQAQLAEKVETQQSSISRLENYEHDPSIGFLRRIAKALDAVLEIRLRPVEEVHSVNALFTDGFDNQTHVTTTFLSGSKGRISQVETESSDTKTQFEELTLP